MKKYMIFLISISLLGLMSCESDSLGDIEGMGDNTGKLQVKEPFEFPQGVLLLGDVTGVENPGLKSTGLKSTLYKCSAIF